MIVYNWIVCILIRCTVETVAACKSPLVIAPSDDGSLAVTNDSGAYGCYNSKTLSHICTNKTQSECYDTSCINTIDASLQSLFVVTYQSDLDIDSAYNDMHCPLNYYGSVITSYGKSPSNNNVIRNKYFAAKGLDIVE